MKIAILGCGYVGLVTGGCLAELGHEVVCLDKDEDKIRALTGGSVPVYEPGLARLLGLGRAAGRLTFSANLGSSVLTADVVFVAVGTPSRPDGHADLQFVYTAASEIAPHLNDFKVVVAKSTVPVGTCDEIESIIRAANPAADFAVVSNPEFLREGDALQDFRSPDRIVVGVEDPRAEEVMNEVYRPLLLNGAPLEITGRRTAELIKYAANAFLAMKVTFINEIADLCEAVEADVQQVARGIGLDRRIGTKFLKAGPGYGGSCFPKDALALVKTGQDNHTPLRLVETTIAVNDQRKRAMSRKVILACGGDVRGKTIGMLGLTFKPDTDDMRDAPSIDLIRALQDRGGRIVAYDPQGMDTARRPIGGIDYAESAYDVAAGADAIVLITEWIEFRSLDLVRLRAQMRSAALVDLRNVFRSEDAVRAGFKYFSIGRAQARVRPEMPEAAE